MARQTIVKWWIGGWVAIVPGVILIPSSLLALADHVTSVGINHGLTSDTYSQALVAAAAVGGVFALVGIAAGMVAWIGAVTNAHRLEDKNWFNLMLWVGIVGVVTTPLFGLGVFVSLALMLSYFIGAPDAMGQKHPWMLDKHQITKWTIWGWITLFVSAMLAMLLSNLTNPWGFLHGQTWLALTLIFATSAVAGAGLIVVSAAYWGEVFNAHRLTDKSWFNVLLWAGIAATITMPAFGLGGFIIAIVGIAYLVAGPDGMAVQPPRVTATGKLPPKPAATS